MAQQCGEAQQESLNKSILDEVTLCVVNAPSCHDHYQYHSQLNACPSTLHEQMGLSPQVNMNEASIIFSERTHKSGHASSHSNIYKKCSMVSNEKYV